MTVYIFAAILIISAFFVLIALIKSRHFFKSAFLTAFQGIASLMAVNIIGLLSGVVISTNWFSLAFCSVFGTPGTITLLLSKFLFGT